MKYLLYFTLHSMTEKRIRRLNNRYNRFIRNHVGTYIGISMKAYIDVLQIL